MSTKVQAFKAKSREPYTFNLGHDHLEVLKALREFSVMSDAELTFYLRRHMTAPRRCELRDAGYVEDAPRVGNSKGWRITDKGLALLDQPTLVSAA